MSGWYENDIMIMKHLQLVILRSQKPQAMTTLKFSKISLSAFSEVKTFKLSKAFVILNILEIFPDTRNDLFVSDSFETVLRR